MNDNTWYDRVDIETLIDSIEELQSVKLAAEKHGYSLANVYDRLKRHGYRVRTEKELTVEQVKLDDEPEKLTEDDLLLGEIDE